MQIKIREFVSFIKERHSRIYLLLLMYSVIIALMMVFFHRQQDNSAYMPTRVDSVNSNIERLNRGLPVSFQADHEVAYHLLDSYIGYLSGIKDSREVFLLTQLTMAFIVLSVFPLAIFRITKSLFISLFSPILIYQTMGNVLLMQKNEINWIFVWSTIMSIPLLYIYYKEKAALAVPFIGLCIVIAVSNVFRTHSALPAAAIFVFITVYKLMVKKQGMIKCAGALLTIAISYILLANIVPSIYAAATNQKMPQIGPWHSIYIGLGWEQNPFNIVFKDECAMEAAQKVDSDIVYLSAEYMNTLKSLYFGLFKEHPWYFLLTYFKKALFCFVTIPYFILVKERGLITLFEIASLFIFVRYVFNKKELLKKYAALFIISLLLVFGNLLYPLMALPAYPYISASMTACNMILLFLIINFMERLLEIRWFNQR